MYHNPEAEGMIKHMDNVKAEFNISRVHNLDDHDDRKFLETNGLILKPGQIGHFKAIENPSTGFTWQIDDTSCKDHIEIDAEYIPAPIKEKENIHDEGCNPMTGDCVQTGGGFGGGRGGGKAMMGAPGHKEFHLKALKKEGRCVFRIALAKSWEFKSFEENNNLNVIEIPLMVSKDKGMHKKP